MFLWSYCTKHHRVVCNVATFNALLSCLSDIPIRFGMAARQRKFFRKKTPIFQLSLFAMTMSLEQLPNECIIYQSLT